MGDRSAQRDKATLEILLFLYNSVSSHDFSYDLYYRPTYNTYRKFRGHSRTEEFLSTAPYASFIPGLKTSFVRRNSKAHAEV